LKIIAPLSRPLNNWVTSTAEEGDRVVTEADEGGDYSIGLFAV